MRPFIIALAVVSIVTVALISWNNSHFGSANTNLDSGETSQEIQAILVPPYKLLKDPYIYKNKIVVLDVKREPILIDIYNGPVYEEIPGGLLFNRMISEDVALYDIMGLIAPAEDRNVKMLGQIAIGVPSNQHQLQTEYDWEVEPLGTMEGTNGFGATLQVPLVRFRRYVTNEELERDFPLLSR
jgi:hypothetical protein